MRKLIDVLLVFILFAVVGYLIFFANEAGRPGSFATSTSTATRPPAASLPPSGTPTDVATATLIPASVTIPTKTITPRPTLPATATPTLTATITPTASITPTAAPTQSALEREINDGIERGNRIVKAIEAYHNAQGVYPANLDLLVPAYLSGIPFTEMGRPFFYRLFDGTGPMAPEVYWLAFRVENREHVTCTYLRRLDYWDCDFASP